MAEFASSYGWWIAGLVLLLGELVLPGVYLLFLGIGALVVGANLLWMPELGWQSQILGFAAVSGAAALLGHRVYGQRARPAGGPPVNEPAARLVGRRAKVSEAIEGGHGRVAVDDGWWSAEGPDAPVGAMVVIEAVQGSRLRVRPVNDR